MVSSDTELVRLAAEDFGRRLPPGWRVEGSAIEPRNSAADGRASIVAPDGRRAIVLIEAKRSLDPRGASELARRLGIELPGEVVIVVSPYLAASVRDRLKASGLGYVDFTGNARLTLSSPGLHLETTGADSDPNPSRRPTRSLRGPKGGRVIRALCDARESGGVRDLAATTGLDPGVVLVLPTDDWVFADAEEVEAIKYAAPSQVAADLLTSPGRGPAEAEELFRWMTANEEKWRG